MTVEEVINEFDKLRMRCDVVEEEEQVIARFLGVLKPEIADIVSLQLYSTYTDVCKLAFKVEKHIKAKSLEVGSIRRIQGLDTAYWGFLGVGTTLDIFQNIHILYLQYGVLTSSGYGVLSFIPLWSLVSAGTDTPYLP
ncbi:hypothetical protein Tco_0766785 [Tanacetum coccineum]